MFLLWACWLEKQLGCSEDSQIAAQETYSSSKIYPKYQRPPDNVFYFLSPYHWDIICWHPTSVVRFWTLIPVACPLGDQAYSKAGYKIFKKIGTLLFFHWHFYPSFDFNLILFYPFFLSTISLPFSGRPSPSTYTCHPSLAMSFQIYKTHRIRAIF